MLTGLCFCIAIYFMHKMSCLTWGKSEKILLTITDGSTLNDLSVFSQIQFGNIDTNSHVMYD